jgi:hypothetical protein
LILSSAQCIYIYIYIYILLIERRMPYSISTVEHVGAVHLEQVFFTSIIWEKMQIKLSSLVFGRNVISNSALLSPNFVEIIIDCVLHYLQQHYTSFRVCNCVHDHTFNWINQPDAETSQVYYLSFKCSSTCFGHPHAQNQELQQLQ